MAIFHSYVSHYQGLNPIKSHNTTMFLGFSPGFRNRWHLSMRDVVRQQLQDVPSKVDPEDCGAVRAQATTPQQRMAGFAPREGLGRWRLSDPLVMSKLQWNMSIWLVV